MWKTKIWMDIKAAVDEMSSFNKAQYTKEGSFWQLGLDNLPKSNGHTTQEFTSLNI